MQKTYSNSSTILVTGATGYIGGRLVPRLLAAGFRVRCLVRDPRKLAARTWIDDDRVEVVEADLDEEQGLRQALTGCSAAYYLVHSMISSGDDYAERDREMATTFARTAEIAGIQRILYLGGLGELGDGLSEHLESRREVEDCLRSTSVPVTVLRAAMIIGSGSGSFEILRYLVERLPIMVTPKWVKTECQPIAVRDVLHYLVASLTTPATTGRTLDIGGADVLTYAELMQVMAEERGLSRRVILPVPVLTPKLSSLWIHLVTPISQRLARPLAEGLRNRVVCRDDEAARLMPRDDLLTARGAIRVALDHTSDGSVETAWSDAGVIPGDPDWAGGTVFVDRREREIDAPPHAVFRSVCRMGGRNGWYASDWLWRVRGWMDRLVGGPGLRRGRRDPEHIAYGDALDFWRVTDVKPDRRLILRAEMKLPGEGTLEFELEPRGSENTRTLLRQTARFQPRGLLGLAYWSAVLPFHHIVFNGMLRGIEQRVYRVREAELDSLTAHRPATEPQEQAPAAATATLSASA